MDPHRHLRVIEAVREELAEMIALEIRDPRVEGASVTEVVMDPGYKKAMVRVAVAESGRADEVIAGLAHASAYLRRQLATRLQLRRTPELIFEADTNIESGRVAKLLKRARRGRPRPDAPVAPEPPAAES